MNITTIAERRRHWPVMCDSGTAGKVLLNASIATVVCAAAFCFGIISLVFYSDFGAVPLVCVSAYFFYNWLGDAIWAFDVLDIHDKRNAMSTHHFMGARLDDFLE